MHVDEPRRDNHPGCVNALDFFCRCCYFAADLRDFAINNEDVAKLVNVVRGFDDAAVLNKHFVVPSGCSAAFGLAGRKDTEKTLKRRCLFLPIFRFSIHRLSRHPRRVLRRVARGRTLSAQSARFCRCSPLRWGVRGGPYRRVRQVGWRRACRNP